MSDDTYEHGKMDISTHEKTFHGFIRMVTNGAILAILVLIFMGLVNG